MLGVLLYIVAIVFLLMIEPVSFVYTVFIKQSKATWYKRIEGYWYNSANALDRYMNYQFRSLLNRILILPNGYQFGNFKETVSSVLGKNERDNTLKKFGKSVVWLLDKIEKDHCFLSINENV